MGDMTVRRGLEPLFWSIASGSSPVIGIAIHDVDGTYEEVGGLMALSDM
ncbi:MULTISPECIES: hypothetical protein [unclassified Rhizobium]|nr:MULTISPECIES: hypothetical protein [unclassified Rhizobium]